MKELSPLQKARVGYQPKKPKILQGLASLEGKEEAMAEEIDPALDTIVPHTKGLHPLTFSAGAGREHSPLRVGVVLSGGQASGGHNVITGLFDALKELHPESLLIGFRNGPSGLIENDGEVLTEEKLAPYRNQGGFDLIGSGRTKIETSEQFARVLETAKERELDGIVIIGGDDSNTNAALLAEYFLDKGCATRVVGVPKTIDGDLKNESIEVSFGFDTACKTYAETVGSLLRDALSAGKYYFFVRLMGRSASHIALECALQTHPNYTLVGEEIAQKGTTLREITDSLCDMIVERAEAGKNYGVILLPEGIVEFIPECRQLIQELNALLAEPGDVPLEKLSEASRACFVGLPKEFQEQLLLDRDPHGNVQVAKIETERFFIALVREELARRKKEGTYSGKLSTQPLYLGYEGRSCLPSNFDAQYCYALGHVAALLIDQGKTGYMSCVQNLTAPVEEWRIAGTPIVSMMHLEVREGKKKPVIAKALVDLEGAPFRHFVQEREKWQWEDSYQNPGPIQFVGDPEITDSVTATLRLESESESAE